MPRQVECGECGGKGRIPYDTWSGDWEDGGVAWEDCLECDGDGVALDEEDDEDDEDRRTPPHARSDK